MPAILTLLAIVVTNGLIIGDAVTWLRYLAALALLAFLPGWVWFHALFDQPQDIFERLTLAIGLSLALTIFEAMFAVYFPGPLTMPQLLISSDVVILAGLLIAGWQRRQSPVLQSFSPQWRQVACLIILLSLAAALRLPRLGYAEFHEDETEALMLGVRLMQGEDYALFLHRKGPAQMLLPVTFWLLTGRTTELMARFPFALSSLLSVATLFFIGRRWFGWQAGAGAGLLWSINGYAIGFGRMVQYQALIFFLGPMAIYCFYLAWQDRQIRQQILGVILLAVCLLAHFDALLLLPAASYLSWVAIWRPKLGIEGQVTTPKSRLRTTVSQQSSLITTILVLTLFLALLASFYVPYVLDPEFKNTATYLSESRVKPGLLYNNLSLLRRLDKDYSSQFYMPVLALGVLGFIIWYGLKHAPKWRWGMVALGILLAATVWMPDTWRSGQLSLAILPWLMLGIISLQLLPNTKSRVAWILFGAAFIGYVFLVDDPRTHLYILYPGATLLAGAGWIAWHQEISHWATKHLGMRLSRSTIIIFVLVVSSLGGAIIVHASAIFLRTESSLNQLRTRWNGSIWQTIYDDLPQARSYFGYPKREGWKAIGALRAEGRFSGDFRSANEDFIVPIWYNFGQARSCYDTPAHFFVRVTKEELPIANTQYSEVGQIQREGEVRLRIFSAGVEPDTRQTVYTLEEFVDTFDRLATPRQFTRQAVPSQRLETQFGSAIRFIGYDLPAATIAPGEILNLNLYWQALENPGDNFRAFVHLTDGTTIWGQQDDHPACRLPTSIWRPEQRGVGQFRLPINPETPPGRYPLIIGLYQADTLERLNITAGVGQIGDEFLWLGDVEVIEK